MVFVKCNNHIPSCEIVTATTLTFCHFA